MPIIQITKRVVEEKHCLQNGMTVARVYVVFQYLRCKTHLSCGIVLKPPFIYFIIDHRNELQSDH